jgi:hypothetical protein
MQTYQRPEVSEADQKLNARLAVEFVTRKRKPDLIGIIVAMLCENQRLVAEVNEHRAVRGFELLPTYDPPKN